LGAVSVCGLHKAISNGRMSLLLVVEKWCSGDILYQKVVFWVFNVFFLGVFGVFWVFFL